MALKRKKAYESQVDKIMGSRMTLEQQKMAIETANVNLQTMNAMKMGADAMKSIHGALYVFWIDSQSWVLCPFSDTISDESLLIPTNHYKTNYTNTTMLS
jgi:hypothetical protein